MSALFSHFLFFYDYFKVPKVKKKKKKEFQYVYLRPRRSATALAACSSAPPGSGTVGPTGKLSHSEGQCWPGLRKTRSNQATS